MEQLQSANSNIQKTQERAQPHQALPIVVLIFPMGAISSTPSTQITTFANGPGNDTFVGGITDPANLTKHYSGGTQVTSKPSFS